MAVSLNDVTDTGSAAPPRVGIYGKEGTGKSTFGASAPNPIFIRTEDGLSAIKVKAFPLAKTYREIEEAIGVLATEEHDFQTVVLDSVDWAEQLIMLQVAQDHGLASYDSNAKPLAFGRGGKAVADYWRKLLDGFDYLRSERGMQVILIGHSRVKRFDDPQTEAYDRYEVDLMKESASTITEWLDILGFINYRVSVKEEQVGINGKKKRGVGSDERFLYTQERPAFNAKSRWALPPEMPLDYGTFAVALSDAMSATL